MPSLGHGLGQDRKPAAQKLRRSNQRLSRKLSNPQLPLIVRQFHLTGLRSLPQFHRIPRPLLKLSGGHFLFQVAGVMRFVCAIIWYWNGSHLLAILQKLL